MSLFEEIKKETRKGLLKETNSHNWEHTERVYRLCMRIAKKEGGDLEVLGLAAILHDIGRRYQDASNGRVCHAERGAILAKRLLEKHGLDIPRIDKVVHCIVTHRFRGNRHPETKEAKILFDADKLDSIGAIGIARAFSFAGEIGAHLHRDGGVDIRKARPYSRGDTAYREFMVKLRKIRGQMFTEEGRRLAEERHDFMSAFFQRLDEEVEGNL